MNNELTDKLKGLEEQVAVIKDPDLRRIAFQRLLESVVPLGEPKKVDGKGKRSGGTTAKKERAKAKSRVSEFYSEAEVREEIRGLSLGGAIKGMPQFKEAKKNWEQYMWVLAAVKTRQIEGMNNHEIAFLLTKRLYRSTKYSSVNNIRSKVGEGLVCQDPETQRWMITPDGEAHLSKLVNSNGQENN